MTTNIDVRDRTVRLNGFRTRLLEAGRLDRPTVLLLHDGAWGGASDVTWWGCLSLMAERFHVVAPDFLGFGGSDKLTYFDRSSYAPRITQIETLCEALGIRQPHVVGSSYGGSVALRMLTESHVEVRSAISIGGTGGPWKTEKMFRELGSWDGTRDDLARVLGFLMSDDHPQFSAHLERRYAYASTLGHYRAVASAALPLPEALKRPLPDDWPEVLTGIQKPVLLVAGRDDELFEPDWPERLQNAGLGAAVYRLDARHSPNLDHPEDVAEIVTRFLTDAG